MAFTYLNSPLCGFFFSLWDFFYEHRYGPNQKSNKTISRKIDWNQHNKKLLCTIYNVLVSLTSDKFPMSYIVSKYCLISDCFMTFGRSLDLLGGDPWITGAASLSTHIGNRAIFDLEWILVVYIKNWLMILEHR